MRGLGEELGSKHRPPHAATGPSVAHAAAGGQAKVLHPQSESFTSPEGCSGLSALLLFRHRRQSPSQARVAVQKGFSSGHVPTLRENLYWLFLQQFLPQLSSMMYPHTAQDDILL